MALENLLGNRSNKEFGLTLVEVLVSVVILSIILAIFLNVFIESANINKTSEEIIDATYIAQQEMERVYEISLGENYEDAFSNIGYVNGPIIDRGGNQWSSYERAEDSGYTLRIRTLRLEENNSLIRVIIEVFEGEITSHERNLQAKMENVLDWGVGIE